MVALDESVRNLTRLAAQLNKSSDELNDVIAKLESQLAESQLGISVWLSWWLDKERAAASPSGAGTSEGWKLGYAKIDKDWCIAVRQVKVVSGFYQGDPDCPWEEEEPLGEPIPLLKAPRHIRVNSARLLEELVKALAVKASEFIESIEGAKKLVK